MKKIRKYKNTPEGSLILDGFNVIDYIDAFCIDIVTAESVDKITTKAFHVPGWVAFLMKTRNTMVRAFGLKTGEEGLAEEKDFYPVGGRAIYFTVIGRNDNEIIMAENDKHLNFRASVFMNKQGDDASVYITTLVHYNNVWGKVYFFFVKPFHKIIIRSLLKKLVK